MKEKGQAIRVKCKKCGNEMFKWQRSKEVEEAHPFPFDSICGFCIQPEKVARHYPHTKKKLFKKRAW